MKIQYAVAAALLAAHLMAYAAPTSYVCPQSIHEASLRLAAPGHEWTPFVASPLYLSSAAPADGPPERLGLIRERDATKTKTAWKRTYALDGHYPDGKWLRWDYGAFGEVSLAKRLPDEITTCTVTGKKGAHAGETQVDVRCR
ncbi:hypothetical protein RCH14_003731 [Massilia sp. MP_M2]|uniref:STY0301 family protein n=1 Tax=Massilia sp. MP_M2 TaxID=3071713 RepID=UPI00319D9CB4